MSGVEIFQISIALFIAIVVIYAVFKMMKTDFGKAHK